VQGLALERVRARALTIADEVTEQLIEHLCVGIAARRPCCVAPKSRSNRSLWVNHVILGAE